MASNDDSRNKMIEALYKVLNQWMSLKEQNKRISHLLVHMGYKNIGIYGMGAICLHLIEEIKDSDISIGFVADNSPGTMYDGTKVFNLDGLIINKPIDICIYTNPLLAEETKDEIVKKTGCALLGIEDLIFGYEYYSNGLNINEK